MTPRLAEFLQKLSSAFSEVIIIIKDGNVSSVEGFYDDYCSWFVNDLSGKITIGEREQVTTKNLEQIVEPVNADQREAVIVGIKNLISYNDLLEDEQEEANYTYRYVWTEDFMFIQFEEDQL